MRVAQTRELPDDDGADPRLSRGLETVARCLRRAVRVLRSEPAPMQLARFVKRALATGRVGRACGGLRFGSTLRGTKTVQVIEVERYPVRFERFVIGEDLYGGGRTVEHIRYRFRCVGQKARAVTTIQRGLGR